MRRGRQLPIALLLLLLPDQQALAGDLCEAAQTRSAAWLWRQVLLALPARALFACRHRLRSTAESTLVGTAMLALLGFHAVVVASLANHLLVLNDITWVAVTGRYQTWQVWAIVPAVLAAVAIGRAVAPFHREHRVAAIVVFAATASGAAFLNLLLFVPDALLRPFVPSAAWQTAISMMFIAGLLLGVASRSACEPLPSS